jgi:hypothetical protein
MALRVLPRTLRSCRYRQSATVRTSYRPTIRQQCHLYSTATSEVKDNPTSSAEQVPTSQPSSPKQVPLTVDSHTEIIRNPKHTKQVSFRILELTLVIVHADRHIPFNSQGSRRISCPSRR